MLVWLTEHIDSRPLGLARIGVGIAAAVRAFVAIPVLVRLTQSDILSVPYFAWVPRPTVPLVVAIVAVWLAAAILFTIGWRVRVSGSALTSILVAVLAFDQQTYSNHLYLMAWLVFLLTLARAGSGLSIARRDEPVARWPVILLMIQLSIVYGFSGITKINPGFLSGSVLAGSLQDGVLPFPDALITPQLLSGLAVVVIAVESALALLIWRARFRPWVFVVGLGLHASITLFMSATAELAVFSIQMLALYPLFLTPEELRVTWPDRCQRCSERVRKLESFDLLLVLETAPGSQISDLTLVHRGRTTHGADARVRILEHLVPWLWVAPLLRLPGVRQLHARRHRHGEYG